jgi:heme/copper-type cytochrome/quinol oxidase subunit 2
MKITIKDYNLQNIIFVHNFVLIFLIFVLLFVGTYLYLTIKLFNEDISFLKWERLLRPRKDFWANRRVPAIFGDFSAVFKTGRTLRRFRKIYMTHNMKLELIWTMIPILIILEIIFPSLSLIASEDMEHKGSLYTVGVIGNQWYWNYELNLAIGVIKYVSNLVLLEEENEEYKNLSRLLATTKAVPIVVGVKTAFYITSNDVNHSWSLPSLGIKVDAIPGRINLKTVIASRLGLYSGMCSELCGVEHGFMPISVQVMTFSNWWYNIKDLLENVNSKKMFYLTDLYYIK